MSLKRGLTRREFLKLQMLAIPQFRNLAAVVATGLGSQISLAANGQQNLSVLQGLTDASTTQISVVVPVDESFHYEIFGGPGIAAQIARHQIFRADSDKAIDRLVITRLVPCHDYVLTISNSAGEQIDQRVFRSLDVASTKARFAFVSCINDQYSAPAVWKSLLYDNPNVVFFVGDTCYTDHMGWSRRSPDPKQIWARHVETRSRIPIYFSPRLVPVLATWDDHDFGGNNSDRRFAYAKESKEIFQSFFPMDSSITASYQAGPGIAGAFTAFGQRFILLDSRTGRSEPGAADPTHWGLDQEKWIVDQAASVNAPTFMFNGSEFFGAYHGRESVEKQHPASLKRLTAELGKLPQVFVMGSGDVHYSEVMEIEKDWFGYPTTELVSSSVQSSYVAFMDRLFHNKRRLKSAVAHNYLLVESEALANGSLAIQAASRGAGSKTYFEHKTTVCK